MDLQTPSGRCPGRFFWILDSRYWILDTGWAESAKLARPPEVEVGVRRLARLWWTQGARLRAQGARLARCWRGGYWMLVSGCWILEGDRCRRLEFGGLPASGGSDVGGQRTEGRGQRTDVRCRMSDVRGQKTEDRGL